MKHQKRVTDEELRALLAPLPDLSHLRVARPSASRERSHEAKARPAPLLAPWVRLWSTLVH